MDSPDVYEPRFPAMAKRTGRSYPAAMLNYTFFAPRQIVFGWGCRSEIGTLAARLGRRAFLVSGSRTLERTGVIDELVGRLQSAGVEVLDENLRRIASRYSERGGGRTGQEGHDADLDRWRRRLLRRRDRDRRKRQRGGKPERAAGKSPMAMLHS